MTGAVPSGRSVSERPPRSSNVYISLLTTSEVSPDGAREQRRCPRTPGVTISPKPARSNTSRASRSRAAAGRRRRRTSRGCRAAAGMLAHRSAARNGFVSRSRSSVVAGPCPGSDHRLAGQRRHHGRDAGKQRVVVGSCEVGAPDRTREQQVADEHDAVRRVGNVRRRVSGNGQHPELEPGQLQRLAAVEQMLGLVRARSPSVRSSSASPRGIQTSAPVAAATPRDRAPGGRNGRA